MTILTTFIGAVVLFLAGVFSLWKYKAFANQWEDTVEPLEAPELPATPSLPVEPITTPPMNPDGPKKLELYYETQPWKVTQPWGVYDPKTYRRFGFDEHSGIDIAPGYNDRIRAPFDYHIIGTNWQPNGGGMVLSIVSKDEYEGRGYVRLDYLHLAKYIKTSGDGNTGDLLCLTGNTGYSTGKHTHIKATWVTPVGNKWQEMDKNSADNTFDQEPYYNGLFAVDYA